MPGAVFRPCDGYRLILSQLFNRSQDSQHRQHRQHSLFFDAPQCACLKSNARVQVRAIESKLSFLEIKPAVHNTHLEFRPCPPMGLILASKQFITTHLGGPHTCQNEIYRPWCWTALAGDDWIWKYFVCVFQLFTCFYLFSVCNCFWSEGSGAVFESPIHLCQNEIVDFVGRKIFKI